MKTQTFNGAHHQGVHARVADSMESCMIQYLGDYEVDQICAGLVNNAAKARYLHRLGLTVRRKPNGRPLVNRKHYDEIMNGRQKGRHTPSGIRWSVPE